MLDAMTYKLTRPKAQRIIDWYYAGEGPRQLIGGLHQHRDLPVQGVLKVLAQRLC